MANEQMYPGLLSQFGLDLTEEDLRQKDLQQRQANGLALAGNLGYTGQGASSAQAGALLAAALGNRGYKPNEQESRRIATARAAGEDMNAWLAQNPKASEKDKALVYQKILGEAAFRSGLPDVGAQAMQGYEAARAQREKQALELKQLGYKTEVAKYEAEGAPEALRAERLNWGLKEQVTAWPMGSTDPTDARDLKYEIGPNGRPTGNLVDGEGNLVYKLGQYTTNEPPVRPVTSGGGGRGGGSSLLTPTAAEGKRQIMEAAIQMMNGTEKLDDLIVGAQKRDGKTDVLGWGGGVASKATELADNVTATMNNIGKIFGVAPGAVEVEISGYDKKTGKRKTVDARSGQDILAQEYISDINNVMSTYVPRRLRETGADAIRTQQNLLNLTYAIMRSKEPGNNRYSDNDFKNALRLAGEGLADPNKLRATLYDRVEESLNSYDIARLQLSDDMQDQIWSPASREYFDQRRSKFKDRFGRFAVPTQAEQGQWRIVTRPGQQ